LFAQDSLILKNVIPLDSVSGLSYKIIGDTCLGVIASPKYSLGNGHLGYYLRNNTRYPHKRWPEEGIDLIKGTLIVSFIVDKTGKINNIRIETSPSDYSSEQILEAISKLQKFQPAKCNSDPIDVTIYYTAIFTGQKE